MMQMLVSRKANEGGHHGAPGLKVSRPGDAFEQEADRVADAVVTGNLVPRWSIANMGVDRVQRQPAEPPGLQPQPSKPPGLQPQPSKPNNYAEGGQKLAEAFMQTDTGKKLLQAVTDDPLVKAGENFLATLPGKIITGAAAAGTVAALAAEHKALPVQIPAIPLGKLSPKLEGASVKITYEGPVDKPTQAMITFSYTPGASKKKKGSETEKTRAETARIAADQDKFRAGMTYAPGSDEAKQHAADQKMFDDYALHRIGTPLPGTGGLPLGDASAGPLGAGFGVTQREPDSGLHMPTLDSRFKPKRPTLLDQKLEMKPMDAAPPIAGDKKKEETPVQRKADGNATVIDAAAVDAGLHSASRPLDRQTQRFMESRIGYDFSKVKIHTDGPATASAKAMGAHAYTVGNGVVFGAGRYEPKSSEGRRLLAHELTHVVQQGGAGTRRAEGAGKGGAAKDGSAMGGARRGGGRSPRRVPVREAAASLGRAQKARNAAVLTIGPVQFRVPTTADLKALFTSGTVPENVLKDRVQLALTRMAKERRLATNASVAIIMSQVFPSPGVFDEVAYEAAVEQTDRREVYQSVLDAEAKVTSADKPKLKTTMEDAAKLIDDCIADTADLQSVFGTKKNVAKTVYGKAKTALGNAIGHMDANITTDYNLDDPETGLGGWARFADQKVHFQVGVVQVKDEKSAKVTIIHESSHLADGSVKDKGYYGSSGFESMIAEDKVTNAAHFEEIPRRKLGISKYTKPGGGFLDFTPGKSSDGVSRTFEDKVKRKSSEYFRKAWDKAVDVDLFVRGIRKDEMAGAHASFNAHKARLLELSHLMHMTIHEQPAATATVNQMDLVLAEGVAHAASRLTRVAAQQTVVNPMELRTPPLEFGLKGRKPVLDQHLELKPIPGLSDDPRLLVAALPTEDSAVEKVIEDSIKSFNGLLGNYAEDRTLLDWLVHEYKKAL